MNHIYSFQKQMEEFQKKVREKRTKDSVFYRMATREKESDRVYEDDVMFIIESNGPMSDKHYLTIPKDTSDLDLWNAVGLQERHKPLLDKMIQKSLYFMLNEFGLTEDKVGLYFHKYPTNTVDWLHIYVVESRSSTSSPLN